MKIKTKQKHNHNLRATTKETYYCDDVFKKVNCCFTSIRFGIIILDFRGVRSKEDVKVTNSQSSRYPKNQHLILWRRLGRY